MPIENLVSTPFTPALSSSTFSNIIRESSLGMRGEYIPMNMALPQTRFPSVGSLGIGDLVSSTNTGDIFPFKDNRLPITDIETPTTILVLDKKTSEIKLQTNKFMLHTISKPAQERFQIIETFGEPSVYFYDKRTRVYTIQGTLLDAEDVTQYDNMGGSSRAEKAKGKYYWTVAFQAFYEDHLRGTMLKQNGQIAAMYINNWFIKGYPVQLVISKDSSNSAQIAAFQMTWVVESDTLLTRSKAEYLYKNARVTPATAQAINNYLDAQNKYQTAYDAWNQQGKPASDPTDLAGEVQRAEKAVKDALFKVRQALLADPANNTNNNRNVVFT